MSSDNGIYILETKGTEYRVAHCLGIDNVYNEQGNFDHNVLYIYFKDSKVYKTVEEAFERAEEISREISFTEYGVCKLSHLNYEFKKLNLEIPVCSKCSSEDIKRDSYSVWNIYTQSWDLESTYDDYVCEKCGEECSVTWNKL